jgi:aryl-alcohol dehydrogenase-like predicted oxidoreductase
MTDSERTRREFLKATSAAVAGAALAGSVGADTAKAVDGSKILNYNPKMGYRRLGKTGFTVSEIGLGGHGSQGLENRVKVLERAAELGINYLDTNIVEECAEYGKALRGKRKNWHIGFASWPEKITTDYEDKLTKEGMVAEIEKRLKAYQTDTLDIWRPVGATWGEGQTAIPTMLMISDRVLEMVVEVFEKVRKEGKVRALGVSAHNPKVFRRVLEGYPQFSVIIFPYLFLTKPLGGDSLLALAKAKDVGVIGLKPFGAGTTFGIKPREIQGKVDERAPVLLREMLQEPRISCVIPGVNVPEQLDMNVKASYERSKPLDAKDKQSLRECTRNLYAHLTPEYQWLRHWETV